MERLGQRRRHHCAGGHALREAADQPGQSRQSLRRRRRDYSIRRRSRGRLERRFDDSIRSCSRRPRQRASPRVSQLDHLRPRPDRRPGRLCGILQRGRQRVRRGLDRDRRSGADLWSDRKHSTRYRCQHWDHAGGSAFGYSLLSVILISNLMAILLQSLCAKLGIVTGRDLAQACRDHYSKPVAIVLWLLCEVAICACDLAEVIGSAIALNLLFKIPLVWGVCITALDVLAVMYLQNKGFRYIEALVMTLILTIGGCFLMEIIFSRPNAAEVFGGFVPKFEVIRNTDMLYVAIGILGATVMPHNLYLHSSIVQTRKYEQNTEGKAEAIKFATIDSTAALMFALFINGAILVVSAATFHTRGQHDVAEIQDAYKLLSPVLSVGLASALFAV